MVHFQNSIALITLKKFWWIQGRIWCPLPLPATERLNIIFILQVTVASTVYATKREILDYWIIVLP